MNPRRSGARAPEAEPDQARAPLNANELWSRVLLDALADSGVDRILMVPGGRASALCLAAARHPDLDVLTHIDERSGAFIALGWQWAGSGPTAVITTSGSAVANLTPALCEADARHWPLIVITCDRPVDSRGLAPPQSTDQRGLCAPLVRELLDLGNPDDSLAGLRQLRRQVIGAVRRAVTPASAGPVQINFPQTGWLCATETAVNWSPSVTAAAIRANGVRALPETIVPIDCASGETVSADAIVSAMTPRDGERGLIVLGADAPIAGEELAALVEATGYPALADAAAPGRCPEIPGVSALGDVLVWHPDLAPEHVERVIRIGGAPVAAPLQDYLRRCEAPVLQVKRTAFGLDFMSPNALRVAAPNAQWWHALSRAWPAGDRQWKKSWQLADLRAGLGLAGWLSSPDWDEIHAASATVNAPGFDFIHAANSMSVRHVNLLLKPMAAPRPVFTQRGVNGIDGTLGCFLGELHASGQRGLLLIGDQALVHDLPALGQPIARKLCGTIVVLNNQGGRIFDIIPCGNLPGAGDVMHNPPAVCCESLAAAFGLAYRGCRDREELEAALAWAARSGGMCLIEVQLPDGGLRESLLSLYRAMLGN